jgi:plastocyanin
MYYPASGYTYGTTSYYPGATTTYGGIPSSYPQPGVVQAGYTTPGAVPSPMPGRVTTEATKARITDESFEPATITIPTGTTVRWVNDGKEKHTVSSSTGAWESGDIQPGKDFTATFTQPGTFEYYCKYHKDMKATVVVK